MTTPTLSMRLFGLAQRAENIRRRRSEAARKAWRTRRRREIEKKLAQFANPDSIYADVLYAELATLDVAKESSYAQ